VSGRGKERFKIRDLLADTRCSQLVLNFLCTRDVRRQVPPPAEDDGQSDASEWELHERREKEKSKI
jgi:hypothetical protein